MKALRDEFEKKLTARRAEEYQKKKAEQDARLGFVRAKIEELKARTLDAFPPIVRSAALSLSLSLTLSPQEARRKAIEEHRLEEERKKR